MKREGGRNHLTLVGETLKGDPALSEKWILQICYMIIGHLVVKHRSISVLVGGQIIVVTTDF